MIFFYQTKNKQKRERNATSITLLQQMLSNKLLLRVIDGKKNNYSSGFKQKQEAT